MGVVQGDEVTTETLGLMMAGERRMPSTMAAPA
jgi:hypothetical protein